MTSRKSYFNFKLFKESLKQQKYIIILHTMFLLLTTTLAAAIVNINSPLASIMTTNAKVRQAENFAEILSGLQPMVMLIIIAVGIITSIFLFNYLYKRTSVQFYHSMEYTRECLYISRFLSGVCSMIIPLIPVYIINSIVFSAIGISEYIGAEIMLKGFLEVLLMYICMFSVSCFAASVSGNFFAQLCMIAFVFLSYTASTAIFAVNMSQWLGNISLEFVYDLYKIFPPAVISVPADITWQNNVYTAIYSLIFAVVGLVLYKFRKSENTDKFYAYDVITIFLKYFLSIVASLLLGLLFYEASDENVIITFIGILVGAFLAYIILQAIFNKNFKSLFDNMKNFAVFAVILLVVMSVPLTMPEMFMVVPSAGNVDSIRISTNNTEGYHNTYDLSEKENISTVLETVEKNLNVNKKPDENNWIDVKINPKGKFLLVTYTVRPSDNAYDEYMHKIYDTEEYKNIRRDWVEQRNVNWGTGEVYEEKVFRVEVTKHSGFNIDINPEIKGNINANKALELIEIFKDEYLTYKYDDIKNSKVYAMLAINYGTNFKVYDCYKNTVQYINDNFAEWIVFPSENVTSLKIEKHIGIKHVNVGNSYGEEVTRSYAEDNYAVIAEYDTDDMPMIESILNEAVLPRSGITERVILTYSDGTEYIFSVDVENFSTEIRADIIQQEAARNGG